MEEWCRVLKEASTQDIRHDVVARFLIENEFDKPEQLRGCADDIAQWNGVRRLTDSEVGVVEQIARNVSAKARWSRCAQSICAYIVSLFVNQGGFQMWRCRWQYHACASKTRKQTVQ